MKYISLLKNRKVAALTASLVAVVPLEILSLFEIHLPRIIEWPLFILLIAFFGRSVFVSGLKSLRNFNFANINLLVTIATIGALYLGQFEEATIIIILFALGNTLEDVGIERSQSALKELVNKRPKTTRRKGEDKDTPIDDVKVGEILAIKPGEYIPLDATVIKGSSLIDESTITGEPLPKTKFENDTVYAGTLNQSGYLEIKVTKVAADTTLAKIIDLTYKSAAQKSHSQQFIDKFARIYTPVIIVIAILLVLVPVGLFNGPFNFWLTEALTLLLIACPCALVISTPVTIFSAIGNATKQGVLIKGGRFLEELGKIKVMAFDKTRTLTKGEPMVSDVVPFNGVKRDELLACVSGISTLSEHPLSRSIEAKAKQENLSSHEFTDFESIAGKGVRGTCLVCTTKHHCMGNLKFITEEHEVEDRVLKQVEQFEREGKATVVTSSGKNKVTGVVGITDEIRPESKATIAQLKQLGITPIILTGDNQSAARHVAHSIGVGDVRAQLLPDQKAAELNTLKQQHQHIAMVGDGVNDAPAITSASVGIVMGAIGSEIAVENADVALMNSNLTLIPYLVKLGRKAVSTIRFNVTLALVIKFVFLALAVFGMSNLALAIFADVGVTILVIFNSLRLFGVAGPKVLAA